jgi:hypothetical protein
MISRTTFSIICLANREQGGLVLQRINPAPKLPTDKRKPVKNSNGCQSLEMLSMA